MRNKKRNCLHTTPGLLNNLESEHENHYISMSFIPYNNDTYELILRNPITFQEIIFTGNSEELFKSNGCKTPSSIGNYLADLIPPCVWTHFKPATHHEVKEAEMQAMVEIMSGRDISPKRDLFHPFSRNRDMNKNDLNKKHIHQSYRRIWRSSNKSRIPNNSLPDFYGYEKYGMMFYRNKLLLNENKNDQMRFVFPFINIKEYREWRNEWKKIYLDISFAIKICKQYEKERDRNFNLKYDQPLYINSWKARAKKIYYEYPFYYQIFEQYGVKSRELKLAARMMNLYLEAARKHLKTNILND